jgi:hypothetical protein
MRVREEKLMFDLSNANAPPGILKGNVVLQGRTLASLSFLNRSSKYDQVLSPHQDAIPVPQLDVAPTWCRPLMANSPSGKWSTVSCEIVNLVSQFAMYSFVVSDDASCHLGKVGADGCNSPMRSYIANISSFGWSYDTQAVIATLSHMDAPRTRTVTPLGLQAVSNGVDWSRYIPDQPRSVQRVIQ